jgi:hypothetical protein
VGVVGVGANARGVVICQFLSIALACTMQTTEQEIVVKQLSPPSFLILNLLLSPCKYDTEAIGSVCDKGFANPRSLCFRNQTQSVDPRTRLHRNQNGSVLEWFLNFQNTCSTFNLLIGTWAYSPSPHPTPPHPLPCL